METLLNLTTAQLAFILQGLDEQVKQYKDALREERDIDLIKEYSRAHADLVIARMRVHDAFQASRYK